MPDMVMDMVWESMDMGSDMDTTTARGLLMLILTFSMEAMVDMDMVDMADMDMDTMDMVLDTVDMGDTMDMVSDTTARGLLMLSPRLMLILTFSMEAMVDMDMVMALDMPDMDMESMDMALDTVDTSGDKSPHCHTCSLLNDNHISIGK